VWGIDKLKVPRSTIPAVTHVDNPARVQRVRHEDNPVYYDMIKAFYELTRCPVIVNTSFNVKDEPIVCTPDDAYRCFMNTGMDALIMGSCVVVKQAAPAVSQDVRTSQRLQRLSRSDDTSSLGVVADIPTLN
jgi:carbamoyltransferase